MSAERLGSDVRFGRDPAEIRAAVGSDQPGGAAQPIVLAAARALFRAPQAEDACWADLELADGTGRACGRPEATSLGLCAEHLAELFGIQA